MASCAPSHRFRVPTLFALIVLIALLTVPAGATPSAPAATGTARSGLIADGYVVYSGNFTTDARVDIYTVPVTGGTAIRLSAGLPDGAVDAYEIVDDRVIFGWASNNQVGLYSAPLAGGSALRLNPEYPSSTTGTRLTFAVAGDRVVFTTPQEQAQVDVLYSVPVTGGLPTRLSDQLPNPGPGLAWSVVSFLVSADGSTVAYLLGLNGSSLRLYTVLVSGGSTTQVSAPDDSLDSNPGSFDLTSDGTRVVYRTVVATQTGSGQRLVSVTTSGASRQELDTAAQIVFRLTPDGSRVVSFRSDAPFSTIGELSSVPVAGGAGTPLGADIQRGFALTPDSGDVLFVPSAGGLQRIPAAGGSATTLLAEGFPNLDFIRFSVGGYGVFTAIGTTGTKLYSFALTGGAAEQISDDAVSGVLLGDFLLAGERAIYFAIAAGGEPPHLYSVPVAGGASVKVNGAYQDDENFIQGLSSTEAAVLYGVGTRISGQPLTFTRLLVAAADNATEPVALSFVATDPSGDPSSFTVYLPLMRR